jgi:hypothetical protein
MRLFLMKGIQVISIPQPSHQSVSLYRTMVTSFSGRNCRWQPQPALGEGSVPAAALDLWDEDGIVLGSIDVPSIS